LNQAQQNHHDRDNDEQVDKTAHRVRGHQAQRPQNYQQNRYGFEHFEFSSGMAFRLNQDPPPSPIDLCGSELIEQYFLEATRPGLRRWRCQHPRISTENGVILRSRRSESAHYS
jgi:hypothetical protein